MMTEVVELPDIDKDKAKVYVKGKGIPNDQKMVQQDVPLDIKSEGMKDDKQSDHDSTDEEPEYKEHYLRCGGVVNRSRKAVYDIVSRRKKIFKIIFYLCLLGAYFVYFGFCMNHSFGDEGSLRLLYGTVLVMIILFWVVFGRRLKECVSKNDTCKLLESEKFRRALRWCLYIATGIFTITYLAVVILRSAPDNAISLAGIAFFIIVGFLFSTRPDMVNWHAVFWGLMTQFFLALLILRTQFGYEVFHWLGERVEEFMAHTAVGSEFIFGKTFRDHFFAFGIMPQIIMLSSAISVLYHFGIIQGVVAKFGWFLSFCLGTSPVESVNAAVNLFFGVAEAPLTIKPFLPRLTSSELHAIMTSGFASIAGSVFGVIVGLGASPDHLLAASVMSAPAALAMAKLLHPETRWTRLKPEDAYTIPMQKHRNFLEAISTGAVEGIKLVGSILVNQLVFVAGVDFVDKTLLWFGNRAGVPGVSFALICSYIFYPLAFLMGFPSQDLFKIGELMGIKIFANSLVGYAEYGKLVRNRYSLEEYLDTYNGTWYHHNKDIILQETNITLVGGILSKRSEVMGVYAFCGLNHLGAIGVMMGVLTALVPHRKTIVSKYVIRANLTGHIACFMTACIAGLHLKHYILTSLPNYLEYTSFGLSNGDETKQ